MSRNGLKPAPPREVIGMEGAMSRSRDLLRPEEKQEVIDHLSAKLNGALANRKLELSPMGSLGGKDSAHDVFIVKASSSGARTKDTAFACKRFRRHENAQRELMAISEAGARGFTTFEAIGHGIYDVDSVGHILVTRRLPRFTTMNQVGWQDHFAGQPEYGAKVVPSLRRIASFVGKMHRAGIIHGDLQLKNIGQVPPDESVLFDLEGATFFDPVEDGTPPSSELVDRTSSDVATLVKSLVCRGYLWSSTDHTFQEEVTDHLLLPYLETAGMHDESVVDVFDQIIQDAIDLRPQVHNGFARAAVTISA